MSDNKGFSHQVEVLKEYLRIFERSNYQLKHCNRMIVEEDQVTIQKNVDWVQDRACSLAPIIDAQATEVDQMICDATKKSEDPVLLCQCDPSFCAWF